MGAAISAVALKEEFDHVKNSNPGEKANRLYKSWGAEHRHPAPARDEGPSARPHSAIRARLHAHRRDRERRLNRQILHAGKTGPGFENLGLIVTISNLRGIPYAVDRTGNNFEERIGYHADQVEFVVSADGQPTGGTALMLSYPDQPAENWKALETAAMATGAFPVALRARIVRKSRAYYERKMWRVATANPAASGDCSFLQPISPAWDNPPDTFDIVCADGGIMNNNPFDCAHDVLVRAAGAQGHVPRTGDEADAAVISVAPFPGNEPFTSYNAEEQSSLINVLKALLTDARQPVEIPGRKPAADGRSQCAQPFCDCSQRRSGAW